MKDCLIYTNIEENSKLFSHEIQDIVSENGETFLEKNSDFDLKKSKNFPDGFLYFRSILEISIKDDSDEILIINSILNLLWNNNISAIASCDFEDKLIHKGGYKNQSIPF
ncbi:hypothetical protein ATE49_12465 [Elizabethkingia miricola]|uniref:1,4-dihydroxy-6-naphthoate synthase n=2 Tax=Elizabethkingia TaxID=308865 RepID=A0A7T7V2Y7_9FLAO|nr:MULTISPECIES: hypothetical protein [Elizabethkingia]AQX87185.1 hypothetical protein AYC65_20240 [Elizabethkingia bruuniana]KUY23859.1 hypothetical protein ATB97_10810 [Elizabethkingia bruuniana]OBS13470.1 hypothetical protein ATE49_12465 [Elizabethkingia miricola]OPB61549.1 hypothetical protein BAY12_13815 [Elizabethkingia bruuniana]QDZ63726.1 hypothetical protein EVD20_15755 [Elizabethkingia bruuniana]